MARVGRKVYDWTPKKGKTKGLMSTYDAVQGNLDTLFDICITHKSWGREWYQLVERKSYKNAKMVLAAKGSGECLSIALDCIDDLAYLMNEMNEMDKGVK